MTASPLTPERLEALELLDQAVVASLLELGGTELLESLIESYREDSGRLVDTLQEAAARGDLTGFERASHALKGSSASIGTCRLYRTAAFLNDCARNGSWPEKGPLEQLPALREATLEALSGLTQS